MEDDIGVMEGPEPDRDERLDGYGERKQKGAFPNMLQTFKIGQW